MATSNEVLTRLGKCRILIVDDHPIVREGLTTLIANEPDMVVCGGAEDTMTALQQIDTLHPDLVVVDLSLKDSHGIELVKQIKARDARIKTLVWSMFDEGLFAERALRAGAMGYVNKQQPIDKVVEAIRQVLRGDIFLSEAMTERLLHRVVGGKTLEQDPVATLSNREMEVFQLIGQGKTTQQIARRLDLSAKTIETHREKIKIKLTLKNSAELSRRAVQWVLEHG